MKYGIIYKITNKTNGKIYIGQTVVSLSTRWRQHCSGKGQSYLNNAIKFYGFDSFNIEEIDSAKDSIELNIKEQTYIKALNCLAPNGYNLKLGGDAHKHHPETRARMKKSAKERVKRMGLDQALNAAKIARSALIGKDPWNKGKKATEEAKRNQSLAHIGQKAWNKGITMSDEMKKKLSQAKLHKSFKIYCIELDKTFSSICEASRELKISTTHIKRCIQNKKKCKGLSLRQV